MFANLYDLDLVRITFPHLVILVDNPSQARNPNLPAPLAFWIFERTLVALLLRPRITAALGIFDLSLLFTLSCSSPSLKPHDVMPEGYPAMVGMIHKLTKLYFIRKKSPGKALKGKFDLGNDIFLHYCGVAVSDHSFTIFS